MVHAQHPPVHPVDRLSSAKAELVVEAKAELEVEAKAELEVEAQAEHQVEAKAEPVGVNDAWQLLLELSTRARAARAPLTRTGFALREGRWCQLPGALVPAAPEPSVYLDAAGLRLHECQGLSREASALMELFAPLVTGPLAQELVIGHLGQSLDGRVATPTGVSQFITGREDLVHTHRLRALFDAVIVGVRTVEIDDPQLTTRLALGEHPTRVVLDPQGKLAGTSRRLFEEASVETLVFTTQEARPSVTKRGAVTWLSAPADAGRFRLSAVLGCLRARGLGRLFVEGGGLTVSAFLAAGLLDRLHVSVAPLILGSGAPAFALPPIDRLEEALPLRCHHHMLGRDVLFDCELSKKPTRSA
jgi:diaminohydroxyphosphoribosylaminopyrimidine deaminase/5-amino-6-(5-phosphoribosylamino)uracil reductase